MAPHAGAVHFILAAVKRATFVLILLLALAAGAWFSLREPKASEQFSGDQALARLKELVAIGPRPPASEGYEKALRYLEKQFAEANWTTHRQSFAAQTPKGELTFTNLLVRHSTASKDWAGSVPVVIGGHLDSKKYDDIVFVGANDGGSSTAVILELARVLSDKPEAKDIEFVLFDGEEAILESITASDGLYGSKHYAKEMLKRSNQPDLGIVLDLVGDSRFDFHYNPETPKEFASAVEKAAAETGLKLRKAPGFIIDDHVPLQQAGLKCLHVIGDFASMPYWHKQDDVVRMIDAKALEKTGRTTLKFLSIVRPK